MLTLGKGKTWNGCRIGHQSRQAWPDLTLLVPEKRRELVPRASWPLTKELPCHSPAALLPQSHEDRALQPNSASESQERTPLRGRKRALQSLLGIRGESHSVPDWNTEKILKEAVRNQAREEKAGSGVRQGRFGSSRLGWNAGQQALSPRILTWLICAMGRLCAFWRCSEMGLMYEEPTSASTPLPLGKPEYFLNDASHWNVRSPPHPRMGCHTNPSSKKGCKCSWSSLSKATHQAEDLHRISLSVLWSLQLGSMLRNRQFCSGCSEKRKSLALDQRGLWRGQALSRLLGLTQPQFAHL